MSVPVVGDVVDVDPVLPPQGRPVDDLATIRAVGEQLHALLEDAVSVVRLNGGSWTDVGRALGITRQSAHARFRHLDRDPSAGFELVRWPDGRAEFRSTRTHERLEFEPARRRQALARSTSRLREIAR